MNFLKKFPRNHRARNYLLRDAVFASFARPSNDLNLRAFSEAEWRANLAWLDTSGLALYFLDRLIAEGNLHVLPPAIVDRLQQNLMDNRSRNAELLAEAVQINISFAQKKIAFANVKGFTLSPHSVPDPALRCQLDLDFIVHADDAPLASCVLQTAGYELDCISGEVWEFKTPTAELATLDDLYRTKPQRSAELHLVPADGLLARSVQSSSFATPFPVLAPEDQYVSQAQHLFKHLCSPCTRIGWLLEARQHMLTRSDDQSFWEAVGLRVKKNPEAAMALCVVALLISHTFGDELPATLTQLIVNHSTLPLRLWIDQISRRYLLADFPGTKLHLLLLSAISGDKPTTRSRRSQIAPFRLPAMIIRRQAGESAMSKARRYAVQLRYILSRLRFHAIEGMRYGVAAIRFRRLLKHQSLQGKSTFLQHWGVPMLLCMASVIAVHSGLRAQVTQPRQGQDVQSGPPSVFGSPEQASTDDDERSPHRSPVDADHRDSTASDSLTAAQIAAVLQDKPELVTEIKQLDAEQLQQQGFKIQADSITDEVLFNQLAENLSLRSMITTFLRARGYLTDAELRSMQRESRDERNPSLSSHMSDQRFGAVDEDTGTKAFDVPSALRRPGLLTNAGEAEEDKGTVPLKSDTRFEDKPVREVSAHNSTDTPEVLHQPAPYNLRSMRDLYTQLSQQTDHLKRFGSDIFLTHSTPVGVGKANLAGSPTTEPPLDIPIGPDYVVGPGDSLAINVWGGVSQAINRVIDREGRIALPDAGTIAVAGLTLDRAHAVIESALKQQYRNAQVDVTVSRLRTVRVYVVGDVQRPGAYDISSLASPLNALYAAGGPTGIGSLRTLRHMRGTQLVAEVDLYEFLLHGIHSAEDRFQGGDTLLIPPAGVQVAISGAVKRPAIYELNREATLADVLADAGGSTVAASLSHITVDRIDPNQHRETVTVDFPRAGAPEAVQAALSAFLVRDGDRIHIAPILPFSERAIYVEGHVVRPGRVAYKEGMRLNDVLQSYQDLLPEPAAQGEIIRLIAPDFHAEAISFDVAAALIGNLDLQLQPFDTIRVLGRYEVDAPKVAVRGEVLRPGIFPLSAGMTAAQLVRMAGGFKRDALQQDADLTSYNVVDGSRIVGQRSSVHIGDAVTRDDHAADVTLKPGDILTIHQITGWNDIGASVTIEGEASHPGSYGFEEGEHLSSVLRRAGGLRATAYPAGAVLIRQQVRELEEKSRAELIHQIETSSAAAHLSPNLTSADSTATLQLIQQQQEQVLSRLRSQPASGRLVIHISSDIDSWANTDADIEVRRGDILSIPKRPGFVLVSGQVYNASAITFKPSETAGWYLEHAGGASELANRKEIFIIRANGSVVGRRSGAWHDGHVLSTRLDPGDVVVVPQKIIGASQLWRNLLTVAQIASSTAITAVVAGL